MLLFSKITVHFAYIKKLNFMHNDALGSYAICFCNEKAACGRDVHNKTASLERNKRIIQ